MWRKRQARPCQFITPVSSFKRSHKSQNGSPIWHLLIYQLKLLRPTEATIIMSIEEAKVEEGMEEGIVDEAAVPENGASPASVSNKRLSAISKKYDIDGDGVLDEAEMRMRMMDGTGRGFLTNDKVYELMQEQIADQKKMFRQKRIILG